MSPDDAQAKQVRFADALQLLLVLDTSAGSQPLIRAAMRLVARALRADAVHLFLADDPCQTGSERGRLALGGLTVRVFRIESSHATGPTSCASDEGRALVASIAPCSVLRCPVQADGVDRGVLEAASRQPDWFDAADQRFLETIARWLGFVIQRAEPVE